MPSAAHRERAQNLEETSQEGSRERAGASSLEARLARERARVATLERALRVTRRDAFDDPSAFTFDGFGTTVTAQDRDGAILKALSKALEPSPSFARDGSSRPTPFGETRDAAAKAPFDAAADSAARTPLLAAPGALAAYGSGEASPRAAAVAAASVTSALAADPRGDTGSRTPFAGHRETPEAAAAAAVAAAESAVGASSLDLETTLARALHAAKRREFEAVTLARRIEGERNAAEARASAAEARLAREAKARRAAERDAAASRARCAVFENRMEALRSGRGRLFGSGAAAASAAPEPERHLPPIACIDEGSRATPANLSDPVPERRRGADDGDGDADGFAFFEIPPEFDAPPLSGGGGSEKALGGAASVSARDAEKPAKDSSARGKTPGKSPRGRTPRGWAL